MKRIKLPGFFWLAVQLSITALIFIAALKGCFN